MQTEAINLKEQEEVGGQFGEEERERRIDVIIYNPKTKRNIKISEKVCLCMCMV